MAGFSAVAALTDLRSGKIYNWLTLPAILAGFVWNLLHSGGAGALLSLGGIAAGFALLIWIYALGFMGAGDVKLLMAFGAFGGALYALKVFLLALVLGGAMAALQLASRGALVPACGKIYRFFRSVFIKELEIEVPKIERKHTMPYGIPLGIAACWILASDPFIALAREGLWPW